MPIWVLAPWRMSDPTPIIFTIPNFITAGSGRALLNIVERLDRTRFSPTICVAKKGGRLDREVERAGIPLMEAPFTIPARPYWSLLWRAWRAANVFRDRRFRIWHSFNYADDYSEPLIARMAGARFWIYTKKNMMWRGRSWRVRTALANRIVAQNDDMMRDFFRTSRIRRKTRLIRRGIDVERFSGRSPEPHLRQELGIPEGTTIVGTVAHIAPAKRFPPLLEALASSPRMVLVIAGKRVDERYASTVDGLIEDLGLGERVFRLGDVVDVPGFLNGLDIFVLPTRGEGCPVAVLEAMAAGLPTVVPDVPGARDLIEDGVTGLIVRAEDPDAMASALRRLQESPAMRSALGQAAQDAVMRDYRIEREVEAHTRLYLELVGEGNRLATADVG
jgi:glycosyltransferase involved in cell wall biosynthesis